jgi:predicted nucleic acid-binding protein
MAVFVLDASIAISWCFPDDPSENTPYSKAVLTRLAVDDAIVPEIWAFEVANNIFVSYSKRKRITEHQLREYLDLLKALTIRVEAQGIWANVDLEYLSRRLNIAAYDAAYRHLAQRTKLPLATSDGPLRDAAIPQGIAIIQWLRGKGRTASLLVNIAIPGRKTLESRRLNKRATFQPCGVRK